MLENANVTGVDMYISLSGQNYTFGNSSFNVFTGQVTNMSSLFIYPSSFNSNINYWDMSNVEDISHMFGGYV
jgi:hypothetical protein